MTEQHSIALLQLLFIITLFRFSPRVVYRCPSTSSEVCRGTDMHVFHLHTFVPLKYASALLLAAPPCCAAFASVFLESGKRAITNALWNTRNESTAAVSNRSLSLMTFQETTVNQNPFSTAANRIELWPSSWLSYFLDTYWSSTLSIRCSPIYQLSQLD